MNFENSEMVIFMYTMQFHILFIYLSYKILWK